MSLWFYFILGKEIVSGSYDKTLRIFRTDTGRSREVYYTKRMQRLSSVLWSSDNRVSEFIRFFLVGFLILNIFYVWVEIMYGSK